MPSRTRLARLVFPCLAWLALGGCNVYRQGETWSFSLTNELLDEVDRDTFTLANPSPCTGNPSSDSWGPLLCVLMPVIAPVALDIALLPVTGVHDLWIRRR